MFYWRYLGHVETSKCQADSRSSLLPSLQEIHSLPSCWHCRPGIAPLKTLNSSNDSNDPRPYPRRPQDAMLWVPGSSSHLPHNKTAGKKFSARGELQLACPSAEFCWPQPQLVQMPGMDVLAQKPILTNTAKSVQKVKDALKARNNINVYIT